ncbi:hypothetical protein Tco_1056053 [Tanacetum coccineum]|uniref:Uncharacterized protein n=1 Tax=Tanacetum coccineum TaxID=301880 RepID=A0ABQ5H1J5_9ASTR
MSPTWTPSAIELLEGASHRMSPLDTISIELRCVCGGGAVGGGGVTATAVSRGDGGDGGRCGAWRSVE